MKINSKVFLQKLQVLKKRENLILLFAVGLLLLIIAIPAKSSKNNSSADTSGNQASEQEPVAETESYELRLEKRLKEVLSKVEGAGEVEVMITLKTSEELLTLQNYTSEKSELSESDAAGGSRNSSEENATSQVLVIRDENGREETVVVQTIMPQIEGIVVCCEGGDKATIIKEITEAVQALFNVPSHKIKVLKRS